MNADFVNPLGAAFATLLRRRCVERKLTQEALVIAAGLAEGTVAKMERGNLEPTLTEFFKIAAALNTSPAILLMDVIQEWRHDPRDLGLYKSRASDLSTLYRLGYHHDPGDFRELPRTYGLLDQATGAAQALNAARRSKRLPVLDTVLIYVRLANVAVQSDSEGRS